MNYDEIWFIENNIIKIHVIYIYFNFGKVCKLKKSTDKVKVCYSLLRNNNLNLASLKYGKSREEWAIKSLEKKHSIKVGKCGFFVDNNIPYLGATPDGIIDNEYIVEVKCAAISCNSIKEAVNNKKIKYLKFLENENKYQLKRNSDYFYQVQGQLHIAKRQYCYFVVYIPKGKPHIELISYDEKFWKDNIINKLDEFYKKSLPSRISERVPCRGSI